MFSIHGTNQFHDSLYTNSLVEGLSPEQYISCVQISVHKVVL